MPKGMKGYEDQPTGGYTKYPAEKAPVTKHGGRGEMQDGKQKQTQEKYFSEGTSRAYQKSKTTGM